MPDQHQRAQGERADEEPAEGQLSGTEVVPGGANADKGRGPQQHRHRHRQQHRGRDVRLISRVHAALASWAPSRATPAAARFRATNR